MSITNFPFVKLQEQWSHGYCPIINGITQSNGIVNQLTIESQSKQNELTPKYQIAQSRQTSISEFQKTNTLQWTSINELAEVRNQDYGIAVMLGEGGMGADGFVAFLHLTTRNLLWVAFFDCSNPFIKARFENRTLIATTSHGNQWTFTYPLPKLLSIV